LKCGIERFYIKDVLDLMVGYWSIYYCRWVQSCI